MSGTITDRSGRTLTGQTPEAFYNSIRHAEPMSVGLNCALGAEQLRPYIEEISDVAGAYVSCHPNAGLPNEFGEYDQSAAEMAGIVREFAEAGFVNIVGGCCGTTPDHVAAIADAVRDVPPRPLPRLPHHTRLSGLEAVAITPDSLFVNVGERTNVTGSARFALLIRDDDYETALDVARQQVESGAQIIDVNMDEGLLDSEAAMVRFLNLIASEPDISRVPVMIDSSKWEVIEAGLRCVQGKGRRELDLAQGRRGGVPREGATGPPLWGRGDRDGLRRGGAGRLVGTEGGHLCPRCLPAPHRGRRASHPKTSSSIPTSSPSLRASRNTTPTRSRSSRRARRIKTELPHASQSAEA